MGMNFPLERIVIMPLNGGFVFLVHSEDTFSFKWKEIQQSLLAVLCKRSNYITENTAVSVFNRNIYTLLN